jgi:hypothetical protein
MDGATSQIRRRTIVAVASVGLVILLGIGWWLWWNRLPQMGSDKAVLRTVDALFTAVTARDESRLADCERRIHMLRDEGKIPAAAAAYLDNIIGTARAGSWQTAAERLYAFIGGQRRVERRSSRIVTDNPTPR